MAIVAAVKGGRARSWWFRRRTQFSLLLVLVALFGLIVLVRDHQRARKLVTKKAVDVDVQVSVTPTPHGKEVIVTLASRCRTNCSIAKRSRESTLEKIAQLNASTERALSRIQPRPLSDKAQALEGPLCVFVPTDQQSAVHQLELEAAAQAWFDGSTVLFAAAGDLVANLEAPGANTRVLSATLNHSVVIYADLAAWNKWHEALVLGSELLRSARHATATSIRGRGQLSIPLFHWISQLVKHNDPLVQNCKWFMKCDTDTYLRRGLLEREVLNKLDHTKPYHVGVPLHFNTRPFNATPREIDFDYNIGGPGYTFSRGLMAAVDTEACVKAMAMEPVLLIHDDVATGYCATYHTAGGADRLDSPAATVRASHKRIVDEVLASPCKDAALCCRDCVASVHPTSFESMRALAKGWLRNASRACPRSSGRQCQFHMMLGYQATIGDGWDLTDLLTIVREFWGVAEKDVPLADRARYLVAKSYNSQLN